MHTSLHMSAHVDTHSATSPTAYKYPRSPMVVDVAHFVTSRAVRAPAAGDGAIVRARHQRLPLPKHRLPGAVRPPATHRKGRGFLYGGVLGEAIAHLDSRHAAQQRPGWSTSLSPRAPARRSSRPGGASLSDRGGPAPRAQSPEPHAVAIAPPVASSRRCAATSAGAGQVVVGGARGEGDDARRFLGGSITIWSAIVCAAPAWHILESTEARSNIR